MFDIWHKLKEIRILYVCTERIYLYTTLGVNHPEYNKYGEKKIGYTTFSDHKNLEIIKKNWLPLSEYTKMHRFRKTHFLLPLTNVWLWRVLLTFYHCQMCILLLYEPTGPTIIYEVWSGNSKWIMIPPATKTEWMCGQGMTKKPLGGK